MPNWVEVGVTIKGKKESVDKFLKAVATSESCFSFDKLIPMPEALRNTTSGSFSDIGYSAFYGNHDEVARILAYSWVKKAGITGQETLKAFLDAENPEYRIQGTKKHENIENFGFGSWYDWSIANWGTKWDACSPDAYRESDTEVRLSFNTAWSFPEPVFEAIAVQFPDIELEGDCSPH